MADGDRQAPGHRRAAPARALERKQELLGREVEILQQLDQPDLEAQVDEDVGDDVLRLVFLDVPPGPLHAMRALRSPCACSGG